MKTIFTNNFKRDIDITHEGFKQPYLPIEEETRFTEWCIENYYPVFGENRKIVSWSDDRENDGANYTTEELRLIFTPGQTPTTVSSTEESQEDMFEELINILYDTADYDGLSKKQAIETYLTKFNITRKTK